LADVVLMLLTTMARMKEVVCINLCGFLPANQKIHNDDCDDIMMLLSASFFPMPARRSP